MNAKIGSGNKDLLGTVPSGPQPDSPFTRKASASQEKDRLTGAETGGTNSRPLLSGQWSSDVVSTQSFPLQDPSPHLCLPYFRGSHRTVSLPAGPAAPPPWLLSGSPQARHRTLSFLPFKCEVLLSRNSPVSCFRKVRGRGQPGRDLAVGWAVGAAWGGEMHVCGGYLGRWMASSAS